MISTDRPNNPGFPLEKYEVYASLQGFISYIEEDNSWWGKSPFDNFAKPVEKLYTIAPAIQIDLNEISESTFSKLGNERCLVYQITNVSASLQEQLIEADIYIKNPTGEIPLYQSSVVLKYDTAAFGINIASNNELQVNLGEISANNNYNLLVSDLSYNKVEVKISASTSNPTLLFPIAEQEVLLAHISLSFQSLSSFTSVELDEEEMMNGSQYINAAGNIQRFGCVDVAILDTPEILDFTPKIVAGGVGEESTNFNPLPGIIRIIGEDFGNPVDTNSVIPPNSRVLFSNIGDAPGNWMNPLVGDYVSWSDTMITVRVPSIGNQGSTNNFSLQSYAGSGKIRVETTGGTTTSSDTLFVVFSAANNRTTANETPANSSIIGRIENANEEGGLSLYFTTAFKQHPTFPGFKSAFIRALNTWRCETMVNYIIEDSLDISDSNRACAITFGNLPAGLTAGTEVELTQFCQTPPPTGEFKSYYLNKFNIIYRPNTSWYTGEVNPSGNQVDFETVTLHELGHGHLLRHAADNMEDLYPFISGVKRGLWIGDLLGGTHIVNLSSSNVDTCSEVFIPMTRLADYTTCVMNSTQFYVKDDFAVEIFPNPFSNRLTISYNGSPKENLQVDFISITGAILQSNEILRGSEKTVFDTNELPKGILFMTISENSEKVYSAKIMKL